MNNIDNLIENLNKEQKEAVISTEGPNLIVAGAGSGKTRVLTTRLMHIINQKKAWANQILCVTFQICFIFSKDYFGMFLVMLISFMT